MIETENGKRMEQILATGVTREQLAEALWCAERSQRMWKECAEARAKTNHRLRELAKAAWGCVNGCVPCDECRVVHGGCTLQSAMRELGVIDE